MKGVLVRISLEIVPCSESVWSLSLLPFFPILDRKADEERSGSKIL